MQKLFSSEIVFRGHPDKVCDQIAGAILRECVKQDKNTHAGIEVCGGKGIVFITGELTTNAIISVETIAKKVLRNVGYDYENYKIINNIGMQSPDINQGVSLGKTKIGAGDQGMMFGYACNETKKYLPKAMVILQEFARAYDKLRKEDSAFLPDGKAQITGIYNEDFNLVSIDTFLVSYQNTEIDRKRTDNIIKLLALNICNKYKVGVNKFLINPTGRFLIGGFEGDAGLTGRKIVVDAYQGFANVGGGNQNGKDVSKVDFSATHKAREIAKRYLIDKNLKWCEVQLSYAIGVEEPVAIYIDSNIGNIEPPKSLYKECTPYRIIKDLDLLNIDYEKLAQFGHFTK